MADTRLQLLFAVLSMTAGLAILVSWPMRIRTHEDRKQPPNPRHKALEALREFIELGKQAFEGHRRTRLRARVQALPQELQDMIFEGVVSHEFGKIIVREDYKPPVALQLNHKLRSSFALEYYRTALVTHMPWARLEAFLTSLSPDHRCMIMSVHMRSTNYDIGPWDRHNMLQGMRKLMRGSKRNNTCFRRAIGPSSVLRESIADRLWDWEMVWVRRRWMVHPPEDAEWIRLTIPNFDGKGPLKISEIETFSREYVYIEGDEWSFLPTLRLLA